MSDGNDEGGFLEGGEAESMSGGGFFPQGHEEEEIPHGNAELTIEVEGAAPAKDIAVDFSPSATSGHLVNDDENTAESDESSATMSGRLKPLSNGRLSKTTKSEIKAQATMAVPRTKNFGIGKEYANLALPTKSESQTPKKVPPKQTKQVTSKREAARKRETAVKSRYFERSSDSEDEENSEGGVSSEEEPVKKPTTRKRIHGSSNVRRSLRSKRGL